MAKRGARPVSVAVIATCLTLVGVHVVDRVLGRGLVAAFALRPDRVAEALSGGAPSADDLTALAAIWTSVLVHADVEHLASNLVFFWLFGSLLAKLAGERWVLIGLLVTPIGAAAAYVLRHAGPDAPACIGASGAITGISGLYVLLAFRWGDAPDVQAWPIARPIRPAQAALLAVLAAALDIYVLRSGADGGVAVDAHVGGFLAGLLLGAVLTTFLPTHQAFRDSPLGPRSP